MAFVPIRSQEDLHRAIRLAERKRLEEAPLR
jgi:hypothetical protein